MQILKRHCSLPRPQVSVLWSESALATSLWILVFGDRQLPLSCSTLAHLLAALGPMLLPRVCSGVQVHQMPFSWTPGSVSPLPQDTPHRESHSARETSHRISGHRPLQAPSTGSSHSSRVAAVLGPTGWWLLPGQPTSCPEQPTPHRGQGCRVALS